MKYSVEESFAFIKQDEDWLRKVLVAMWLIFLALLIFFIPLLTVILIKSYSLPSILIVLICSVISLILVLSVGGFILQFGHDRITNRAAKLPEWNNFWTFVFISFKSCAGSIMFYIPVILVKLIAIELVVLQMQGNIPSAAGGTESSLTFFADLFVNLFSLFYMFIYFAFHANFVKDFNMFSYLNYAAAFRLMKGKFVSYLVLIAVLLAVGIVFEISSLMLVLTIIGTFVIPFVYVYIKLVCIDFIAQFMNKIDKTE